MNPVIFNRNPSVRRLYCNATYNGMADDRFFSLRHLDISMMDNSMKPWMSYDNIDAIVMAGTPEWRGGRNKELFLRAIKNDIPVYFIGIDGAYSKEDEVVDAILDKTQLLAVRNSDILSSFDEVCKNAVYLPCPSLFSSLNEKRIRSVKTIGLIYRAYENEVTVINGWDKKRYDEQISFYKSLIKKYKGKIDIRIICHYIDELRLAERDFPEENIYYSYNSDDYYDIYNKCDLVIGSRIHGIGIATSMGIPSIATKYDFRSGTYAGFVPKEEIFNDRLNGLEKVDYFIENIESLNNAIIEYKIDTKGKYVGLLKEYLDFKKVKYDYTYIHINEKNIVESLNWLCEEDSKLDRKMMRRVIYDSIESLNDFIKDKRVLIKGGGRYARELIKLISNEPIIGIIDNKITSFYDYKVYRNCDVNKLQFDYIIIASRFYRSEMIDEIKKYTSGDKILSLDRIVEDNYVRLDRDFYELL